jgi:hypothetical protein
MIEKWLSVLQSFVTFLLLAFVALNLCTKNENNRKFGISAFNISFFEQNNTEDYQNETVKSLLEKETKSYSAFLKFIFSEKGSAENRSYIADVVISKGS